MKIIFTKTLSKSLLIFGLIGLCASCSDDLIIVDKQESEYHIILPKKAKKSELKAASLMQRYVQSATGFKLPIMRDRDAVTDFEICLGVTNRFDPSIGDPSKAIEIDGYRIKTSSEKLFIYGASPRGTLNGVTSFLEDYLGARVYSSEVQTVPEIKKFRIPHSIDKVYNPPVKFRSTHYRDTWNTSYSDWHKLDHNKDGSHPDWGYWCHSFNVLVPPDEYYQDHPEYYAELNGSRVPAQLCLTNPDVYDIALKNLRKAMDEQPDKTYWSVSQNDNVSYCQCDECRKIDEAEGTPMGSLLSFINRLASEFPDKVISTLAYQYSRQAPKNIKPAANVNIMLCTIELNRSIAIKDDPGAASFRHDLEDWANITEDILLWDYVIQFENLVSPFPNLRVLQPNLQYFVDNHADKHFQQGNREVGGEFAELRAYLISKLLWDPYIDLDIVMNDFLLGYYGKAGKFIRQYIDVLHDELGLSGQSLNIFGHPVDASHTWLRQEKMMDYEQLFDKAERAVKADPEVLERVRIARMPLEYAKIEIALRLGTSPGGMYVKDDSGRWMVREEIPQTANELVERAILHGVTRFKEWHTTPAEYLASLERTWEIDMQSHLAYEKTPILDTPASKKYAAGNEGLLTDGLRGPQLTYAYNWLGFEGVECEVSIDLGSLTKVQSLNSSWLQDVRSWVFYPQMVSYSGSVDGDSWIQLGEIFSTQGQQSSGVNVQEYGLELNKSVELTHIKLKTNSYKICPEWHPGSSSPAWIFIDEIIVK